MLNQCTHKLRYMRVDTGRYIRTNPTDTGRNKSYFKLCYRIERKMLIVKK